MGGIRLTSLQKKADLGPSHVHNLRVSRSCCRTPGCYQRGGQQLLPPKAPHIFRGVRMPVSCRADCVPVGCGHFTVLQCAGQPSLQSALVQPLGLMVCNLVCWRAVNASPRNQVGQSRRTIPCPFPKQAVYLYLLWRNPSRFHPHFFHTLLISTSMTVASESCPIVSLW